MYDYEGLVAAMPELEPLVRLHQPYLNSKDKSLRVHNVRVEDIGDLLLISDTETSYNLLLCNDHYLGRNKY